VKLKQFLRHNNFQSTQKLFQKIIFKKLFQKIISKIIFKKSFSKNYFKKLFQKSKKHSKLTITKELKKENTKGELPMIANFESYATPREHTSLLAFPRVRAIDAV
jgi:hypothetical protein